MKLAAMEALWSGESGAGLVVAGVPNPFKELGDDKDGFLFNVKVPGLLSILATRSTDGFVAGINDLAYGNPEQGIVGVDEKIRRGKIAVSSLADYKSAKKSGSDYSAQTALQEFDKHRDFLGYGYLQSVDQAIPPVSLVFYAFRVMVGLGTFFVLLFLVYLFLAYKSKLENNFLLHVAGIVSIFLGYIAQQAGWIVSEVGRQPWAIQDMLPVTVARSNLDAGTVAVTFFLFLALFTALLIAELKIMAKQISLGPAGGKS